MVPTYSTVGAYMSPYMDQVVRATTANMQEQNARQQQDVVGNAIAKGAYGGNRVGVAQAELARQQNLANQQTIAGLYQQGYQGALGAAQADKSAALDAAGRYAGLGQTQMQTALEQAGAQLGAGTQQQQFDYQQYLNALAFPYQQTSWLAQIAGGLAPSAGGTTTQQKPEGNIWSQLLGTGLAVASLFKDGGRVHAAGGGVMPYSNDNGVWPSYMPGALGMPYSGANDNGFGGYIPQQVAIGGGGAGFPTIRDEAPAEDPLSKFQPMMREGAGNIRSWLTHRADGGVVGRSGYAAGGEPTLRDQLADYIARRNAAAPLTTRQVQTVPIDPATGMPPKPPLRLTPEPAPTQALALPPNLSGMPSYTVGADGGLVPEANIPVPMAAVDDGAGLAPEMAYAPPPRAAEPSISAAGTGLVPFSSGAQFTTTPTPDYSQNIGDAFQSVQRGEGLNLDPSFRQSLLAAGLGMMASKSPFALAGIGEGGLAGVETWNQRQALERENALARGTLGMTGGQLARTAADIGLIGAQTAQTQQTTAIERYDFKPTMAGMMVVDKLEPTQSTIVPYSQFNGWAESHGIDPSAVEGMPAEPTMRTTTEGPRFDVPVPRTAQPGGMAMTPAGEQIVTNLTTPMLQEAQRQNATAQEAMVQLMAMQNAASHLPSSGVLSPGSWGTERAAMAKAVNSMAALVGADPLFDPQQVASIEEMNKLTTQFGFDLARRTGNDVAASVIGMGVGAVPSIENTPQGFRAITSLIQAGLNRTRDYSDFLLRWANQTGGDLTGAAEYFNRVAPPSAYADAAILASAIVPKSQEDIDKAPPGTLFNINGELMVKKG